MLVNPANVVTVERSGDPGRSIVRLTDGTALTVHGDVDHLEEAFSPEVASEPNATEPKKAKK